MGYRVLYGKQLLFDPYTDDRITDTKLSSKLNAASYFDFTIAPTHSLYSKIEERAEEVRIYFNNLILFKGEITKKDEDFEGNYSVSCTGVLDYLTATRVRPYSTVQGEQPLTCPATFDGYFQWLVDQHNSNCLDSRKRFSVGVNQGNMLDKNNYIYRSSEQRPTTASEIEDKILNSAGGYLFVRYQEDLNILDLYADVHDVNTQIIDYGVNMLDFTKTTTTESQYTAVVATGYTPNPPEGQPDAKMKPITLEGCADGGTPYSSTIVKMGDRVYDVEAVNRYGYHEYYVSNTDITTYDGLLYYACKTLNTLLSPALTISVKAVDLALIMGEKYQHLQLGQAVRIRSKPRKVDEYLMVNSIDLDLMNPENTTFDLGASYDTLTGQQSAYLKALNASINSSLDTVDALSTNVKNSAKLAQEAKEKADTATDAAADAAAKADKVTDIANSAVNKAENAVTKADTAISTATDTKAKVTLVEKQATEAKAAADTAKKAADDAATAADSAQSSAAKANEVASNANTAASNAQSTADSALSSAAQANKDVGNVKTQITAINKEMTSVKQDAATLRDDLTGQITTVKETMEADYTKKSELSATESNLKTEISKSAAGLRTEVSQTYSTKKELETTTKAAQTAQSTANAAKKAAESNASDLAKAVSKFDGDITNLKDQIDGAIQTWFYDGIPNALTEPEVHWTTEKDRQTHLGDLYYDNKTGFCYRYMHQNGVYSWARIKDTEVTKALSDAAKAQTTANAKKRIFIATPKPPYDIGDLWVQGSSGDIMRCQTPKIASQTYAEADWVKASKYTDDTAVKNLSNTVERTYATKSTVNQLSDRIEQTVSSVEEVRTDASAAKTTADNAQKAANNAAAAASTAHATATAAQTAANKAQEHATSAANAASTAKANADAAQAAANKANASLADAKKNLETLQNRADVTDEELTAAKNAVASAQAAADSANSAASKANKLATTAQSTADTAKQNAATAQSKANAAASAASTAQSTADTAKANAKKAQDDVNALKNRVTQAETKITQNSEAIALRATKTEVTSAIDDIQIGSRNLLIGTETPFTMTGNNTTNQTVLMYRLFNNAVRNLPSGTYVIVCDVVGTVAGGSALIQWNDTPYNIQIPRINISTTGYHVNHKFTLTADSSQAATGIGLRLDNVTGNVTISHMKLEYGNKATAWSPAPEDLKIDASNKANTALSESKKYTDAQLKITSESITSTVSKTYATKTELGTTNGNVTKAQNTANTASSNASTALSTANTVKNDLANLKIGGRNLLLNSNFLNGTSGWLTEDNCKINVGPAGGLHEGDAYVLAIANTGRGRAYNNARTDKYHLRNVEYSLQFKYKTQDSSPVTFYVGVADTSLIIGNITCPADDTWRKFTATYISPMTGSLTIRITSGTGRILIGVPKLEYGNKVTDWSPAPEDYSTTTEMQSKIEQTANSITSAVSKTYQTKTDMQKYPTVNQTAVRYTFSGSTPSNSGKWIKLGTWTSSGDSSCCSIQVLTGNGYNGLADQNSDFSIFIKDGYQGTPSASKAFGVTVTLGLNCANVRVQVRAKSNTVCDVWFYCPWHYGTGSYMVDRGSGKWEDSGLNQTAEPTDGTSQSISMADYLTSEETRSAITQTAESIKSTVAATYVNNETLSSYATKSQLEQTSTSLTSRIQTTEKSVSGMSTTVKNVNDYMTFARENNQPTLTIGSSSSSFRTKLTNTGEKFMQGDQTIMELDGITSTVKASRVQMGHYQWRDTGTSMQLVYIP